MALAPGERTLNLLRPTRLMIFLAALFLMIYELGAIQAAIVGDVMQWNQDAVRNPVYQLLAHRFLYPYFFYAYAVLLLPALPLLWLWRQVLHMPHSVDRLVVYPYLYLVAAGVQVISEKLRTRIRRAPTNR